MTKPISNTPNNLPPLTKEEAAKMINAILDPKEIFKAVREQTERVVKKMNNDIKELDLKKKKLEKTSLCLKIAAMVALLGPSILLVLKLCAFAIPTYVLVISVATIFIPRIIDEKVVSKKLGRVTYLVGQEKALIKLQDEELLYTPIHLHFESHKDRKKYERSCDKLSFFNLAVEYKKLQPELKLAV